MKWTTEKRKINELVPYEHNPRQLTDKQHKDLESSLKKFDLVEIPAINTDGTILAGHQRLAIMQQLGRGNEEIDVRVPDKKLTDKQVKEYNIRSNKNTGEWDWDILANSFELDDLQEWGFDAKDLSLGFPEQEVEEDEAPEVAEGEPDSKLGEVYELGRHRLMCGDATKKEDVEKLMDGQNADMVFTDPPYGVDYVSRVDKDRRKPWGGITNDDLKDETLRDFLYDTLIGFKNVPMYVCCNWQSYPDFYLALGRPNNVIVWDKGSIGLGSGYRQQYELITFYGVLDHNSESNIWNFKRDTKQDYNHPTQKPLAISARAMKNSSNKDDIVLDLFGGSGSTLIAAEQTGRTCYMMELDPKYCDVIRKRYDNYVNKDNRE